MTSNSQDLTCKELVELITDYLEGTLPTAEKQRFDEHLLICPGCTSYLDQMRTAIHVLGTLREESIPHDVKEKFLGVFRTWKAST